MRSCVPCSLFWDYFGPFRRFDGFLITVTFNHVCRFADLIGRVTAQSRVFNGYTVSDPILVEVWKGNGAFLFIVLLRFGIYVLAPSRRRSRVFIILVLQPRRLLRLYGLLLAEEAPNYGGVCRSRFSLREEEECLHAVIIRGHGDQRLLSFFCGVAALVLHLCGGDGRDGGNGRCVLFRFVAFTYSILRHDLLSRPWNSFLQFLHLCIQEYNKCRRRSCRVQYRWEKRQLPTSQC